MTAPMGCTEAVEHLWDLLDGDLDAADRAALDAHLAWCLRCCGELELARRVRGLLRDRATDEVPPDVHRRLSAFVTDLCAP